MFFLYEMKYNVNVCTEKIRKETNDMEINSVEDLVEIPEIEREEEVELCKFTCIWTCGVTNNHVSELE